MMSEQVKLSEELAQLGAVDEDGRHAHLCHKARELEAEVESLRAGVIKGLKMIREREGELDAYRAAVAEVGRVLDASKWCNLVDQVGGIISPLLDKLPKDTA